MDRIGRGARDGSDGRIRLEKAGLGLVRDGRGSIYRSFLYLAL